MELLFRRRNMMAQNFGPRPTFYTWLLFDGTAYIDTDIVPPEGASFSVLCGYETTLGGQRIFGQDSTNEYTRCIWEAYTTSSTNRVVAASYDSPNDSALLTKNLGQGYDSFGLFLTPNGFGWGGDYSSFTKGDGAVDGTLCIGTYHSSSGTPFTGALSDFNIYGSDAQNVVSQGDFSNYQPIKTLRPCIYEGEEGFWNIQDRCFYGNSNSSGALHVAERVAYSITSYDTTNYSYASVSNISNAYAGASSTTSAKISLKTGSKAETWVYFKFDTSSIPEDATIVRVVCVVKTGVSTINQNMIATRQLRMYTGTTEKGTATTISATGATLYRMDCGTWTRQELSDIRVRLYAKRGSSGATSNYYYSFYGATLYVFYK